MIVRFLPRARQRIRVIAAWWKKNRTITPTLFEEELADLTERLKVRPFLGTEHETVDGETIRKTQLRKTEQDVYYSVDEANGVIYVHTVWGARRGRKPKL